MLALRSSGQRLSRQSPHASLAFLWTTTVRNQPRLRWTGPRWRHWCASATSLGSRSSSMALVPAGGAAAHTPSRIVPCPAFRPSTPPTPNGSSDYLRVSTPPPSQRHHPWYRSATLRLNLHLRACRNRDLTRLYPHRTPQHHLCPRAPHLHLCRRRLRYPRRPPQCHPRPRAPHL